ncbi:MAG: PTS sugar transporter subunit IIA [Sphingobacteriia bacterium]|nr:PTS sugar transporter subunit IIA [Sphingobacteriia bacterium]NCC38054.1 PTS sugar transporter subunit IIA [Gammaproteobacteria bacterium]
MSVGILLITHVPLGNDLVRIASRVLGACPPGVEAMEVINDVPCDRLIRDAGARLERLDTGDGVLILTDLYGSTPANVAVAMLAGHARVRVVAGVNLPMVLRALNYAGLDLDAVAEKAVQGGRSGVLMCAPRDEES